VARGGVEPQLGDGVHGPASRGSPWPCEHAVGTWSCSTPLMSVIGAGIDTRREHDTRALGRNNVAKSYYISGDDGNHDPDRLPLRRISRPGEFCDRLTRTER
jgi:hypothetical protein